MNTLLKVYSKNNLGDDLFIKILTNRYKDNFIIVNGQNNVSFETIENLTIKNSLVDKVIKKFFTKYSLLENKYAKKSDLIVLLGGSMFIEYDSIENNKKRNLVFSKANKPYYIMGANFGPYKTEEFKEEYKKLFSKAEDVCFREEYSANLFRGLNNVRHAEDIVFSHKVPKCEKEENTVLFSLIDCDKKMNGKYSEKYEKTILDLIYYFVNLNYNIKLMSFCKYEGDEAEIEKIKEIITDDKVKSKISTYFYNGNIDEAINVINSCKIVVGTRFHATILGLLLNKTTIPIIYSKKTSNVLDDLGFEGTRFDLLEGNCKVKDIDLDYKFELRDIPKNAEKHFEKLDKVLEVRK